MKKYLSYAIAAVIAVFLLTPPWDYHVTCAVNSPIWLWCVVVSGFLSFLFIYADAPLPLKLLIPYVFITSFLSVAPYWSFMMGMGVVLSAYFYLACKKIDDFTPVLNAVQAVFFVICALLVTQVAGHDTLFNFNRPEPVVFGLIANKMISATLICCMAPFLLAHKKLNIIPLLLIAVLTHSAGMLLALVLGIFVYAVLRLQFWAAKLVVALVLLVALLCSNAPHHAIDSFSVGRGPVWKRTIKLTLAHPIKGWGAATYALVFPNKSRDLTMLGKTEMWEIEGIKGTNTPAQQAHNDFLQWAFELGSIGYILLLGYMFYITYIWAKGSRDEMIAVGAVILGTLMSVHFPTRLFGAIPIILCYLAYAERSCHALARGTS